jgi:hypothetical protein
LLRCGISIQPMSARGQCDSCRPSADFHNAPKADTGVSAFQSIVPSTASPGRTAAIDATIDAIGERLKNPCRRISIRSAARADGKGADDCLATFVHMYMLDPHELRAAVPQAAPSLYLDSIGTLKSGRRGADHWTALLLRGQACRTKRRDAPLFARGVQC